MQSQVQQINSSCTINGSTKPETLTLDMLTALLQNHHHQQQKQQHMIIKKKKRRKRKQKKIKTLIVTTATTNEQKGLKQYYQHDTRLLLEQREEDSMIGQVNSLKYINTNNQQKANNNKNQISIEDYSYEAVARKFKPLNKTEKLSSSLLSYCGGGPKILKHKNKFTSKQKNKFKQVSSMNCQNCQNRQQHIMMAANINHKQQQKQIWTFKKYPIINRHHHSKYCCRCSCSSMPEIVSDCNNHMIPEDIRPRTTTCSTSNNFQQIFQKLLQQQVSINAVTSAQPTILIWDSRSQNSNHVQVKTKHFGR